MHLPPAKKLFYGLAYLFLSVWFLADGVLQRGPLTGQVFQGPGLIDGRNAATTGLTGSGIRTADPDLITMIAALISAALPYAAAAVLLAFIISGLIFLVGFGSDTTVQRAQKIMLWSIAGFVLIVFSYPIVDFVVSLGS